MEPSRELRDIVAGWFKAVASGDTSWVDRHVSSRAEVLLVGTDPSEWLLGARAAEFMKNEAKAMGGNVKTTDGDPVAYREGTVGWAMARPTITLPDGKTISPRWGAVFHQEGNTWKLVQLHASVGVPNEQLMA